MAIFIDISGSHGGRILVDFFVEFCDGYRPVGQRYYSNCQCDAFGSTPCSRTMLAILTFPVHMVVAFVFSGFQLGVGLRCSGFRFQMAISTCPTRGNPG